MARLTPKHQKFVSSYLASNNATQAYIDAFGEMDRGVARRAGSRLLTKVDVKEAVDAARDKAIEQFPLTYEGALSNMWEQARHYGPDASHMARVKATEKVMEHFRPPASSPPGVTVHVNDADELRRRVEQLRARILAVGVGAGGVAAGEPGRLLTVAPAGDPEVQLGVAAPQGDPRQAATGD